MCVVLVEDEPILRMVASELLAEAGHSVVEFSTAAEAKVYCDVPGNWMTTILTDINMPGEEDGLDLAAHVRLIRPEVKVIVTSGRYAVLPSGMPAASASCRSLGQRTGCSMRSVNRPVTCGDRIAAGTPGRAALDWPRGRIC